MEATLPFSPAISHPPFLQLVIAHQNDHTKATVHLFSLFSSSSLQHVQDYNVVYDILLKLLPRFVQEPYWISHLQPLLNHTSHLPLQQEALALALAQHFSAKVELSNLRSYITPLHYYAKALTFAPTQEHHRATSYLIFNIIRDVFKEELDRLRRGVELKQLQKEGKDLAFEKCLKRMDRWNEFGCTKQDQEELCLQAQKVLKDTPEASRPYYQSCVDLIGNKLVEPFTAPSAYITERYRQKLSNLRQTFCAPSDDVRAQQKTILKNWILFFQETLLEDIFTIIGPPPCGYDIRAMGSLGKEEPCPYSDLEYFILIEKETPPCRTYFTRLAHILELQLITLGETAPTDFPVFTALGKKHRSGFRIDTGGNPAEDPIQLIATPQKMATFATQESSKEEGGLFPNNLKNTALKTVSLSANDPSLYKIYLDELQKGDWQKPRALQLLHHRLKDYQLINKNFSTQINLKTEFVTLLNYVLTDLSLFFGIEATNTLDIIDALASKNVFAPLTCRLLQEAIQNIYKIRLRLHTHDKEQKEEAYSQPQLGGYVLSFQEQEQLSKIRGLLLEPLYFYLQNLFQKGVPDPHIFKEQFSSIDLPPIAFNNLFHSIDNLTPLKAFLTHLVPTLKEPQDHAFYYKALSKNTHHESLREHYILCLSQHRFIHVASELLPLPNIDGFRQSTRQDQEQLKSTLLTLTADKPPAHEPAVKVVSPNFSKYLTSQAIQELLDSKGDIKRSYPHSAHPVSATGGLHFKQMPLHPLMEYAVYSLNSRLTQKLSSPTQLVRFEVTISGKTTTYPVLVSETISGTTLATAPSENTLTPSAWKQWSWMILSSLLTKPGDGRRSNYILTPQNHLYGIDNDISMVEPVVKKLLSRPINFRSVLFLLFPHKPLDPEVLEEFCSLNIDAILNGWVEDLIAKEKEYLGLFSEKEREEFYNQGPGSSFRATLLIREGTLATLNLQFWRLQNYISPLLKTKITSLDLLKELISLREEFSLEAPVGIDVHKKYQKALTYPTLEERWNVIAPNKSGKSMSVSETNEACLGNKTPTFEEVEKRQLYSVTKAREELFFTLLARNSSAAYVGQVQGTQVIQADFSRSKNVDITRQELILQALTYTLNFDKQKPTTITLRGCSILDGKKLAPFLHDKLEYLDLSGCDKITDADLVTIAARCPSLKVLHLNQCSALKNAVVDGYFSNAPLYFSALEELYMKECLNFTTIDIVAPYLKVLNMDKNAQLKTVKIGALFYPNVKTSFNGCSQLDVKDVEARVKESFIEPFGAVAWSSYFGDIGKEPPLPRDIVQIWMARCPFWPDKKVKDTHVLVLIPQIVNGKPLTLKSLDELVQSPKQGPKTKYDYFRDSVLTEHGDTPAEPSHWVLLTRDVIPNSRNKPYAEQQKLVTKASSYQVPKALEAAVCLFMEHARTGNRLYSDSPWTYTRCQEKTDSGQLVVGGFGAAGLSLHLYVGDYGYYGVGGLRKFL